MNGEPYGGWLEKGSRTASKKAKIESKAALDKAERENKAEVRRRDKVCRFPLCGCRRIKLALVASTEVSHSKHKGSGGNPAGDRSVPELMVLLCKHRHQDGRISVHKGTIDVDFQTSKKFNGPVTWRVDLDVAYKALGRPVVYANKGYNKTPPLGRKWLVVAKEKSVGQLDHIEEWQREILMKLAEMEY